MSTVPFKQDRGWKWPRSIVPRYQANSIIEHLSNNDHYPTTTTIVTKSNPNTKLNISKFETIIDESGTISKVPVKQVLGLNVEGNTKLEYSSSNDEI